MAMNEATLITNVVPMHAAFKAGVWRDFWQKIGTWSALGEKLNIVTGPVFDALLPYGIADPVGNHT